MKVAIQGCAHGELDNIYATIAEIERREGYKIDLLLCCGDFQAIRNLSDLEALACPPKYRALNSFWKYYKGVAVAPLPTIFIGGNHEASNYLSDLYYGGWVAPNIFFLGFAGVVRFGGLRIGGLSGIYKPADYRLGHFEAAPYNSATIRSIYHIRQFDVNKLLLLPSLSPSPSSPPLDIFLSHDWPRGIAQHGNMKQLLQKKPFFRAEVESNSLGSAPAQSLLSSLRPSFWFAAHLHVKFAAVIHHPPPPAASNTTSTLPSTQNGSSSSSGNGSGSAAAGVTRFLALDKCLPRRPFLQVLDFPSPSLSTSSPPYHLEYDDEWLAITRATAPFFSSSRHPTIATPPPQDLDLETHLKWVQQQLTKHGRKIPSNFCITAPPYGSDDAPPQEMAPGAQINPQTKAFMDFLELPSSAVFGGIQGKLPEPLIDFNVPATIEDDTIEDDDDVKAGEIVLQKDPNEIDLDEVDDGDEDDNA